jgi:hypothetical protein
MIHGTGIVPDVVVPMSKSEWRKAQMKRLYDEVPESSGGSNAESHVGPSRMCNWERAKEVLKGARILNKAEPERTGSSRDRVGIETSCDESAAAVVGTGGGCWTSVVYSQVPLHQPNGGVVPEIASRSHVEKSVALCARRCVQAFADGARRMASTPRGGVGSMPWQSRTAPVWRVR